MHSYFVSDKSTSAMRWFKVFAFGTGLALAATIVALLLMLGKARAMSVGEEINVAFGPLSIITIGKSFALDGGYMLVFTLRNGLALLFALCYGLEALVIFGPHRFKSKFRPARSRVH